MALERELPFWITRLGYAAGVGGAAPLFGSDAVWMGAEPEHVALRWRSHLQKRLDAGEAPGAALGLLPGLEGVEAATVRIELPRRGDVHEALTLELPALVARAEGGRVLATAPGTGASWPGANREQALEGLRQRLTLELLSRDDLGDGAVLLELLRVRAATAETTPETLRLPTFGEVRAAKAARERVLPSVTRQVPHAEPAALVEREVEALARAVDADRSVILVGPHGSGKTAVVLEWARTRAERQLPGRPLRQADAPGLLLALLARGWDWQGPLAKLVEELDKERGWLVVGPLAEWFEVGRYAGNDTSLGEQLRTPIARRQVRLVAECTPEDLARLEARYPGHLEGWQRVVVPVPGGPTTRDVCRAWVRGRRAAVDDDAVTELLRLHQRFAPYSGQPGRALRALRSAVDGASEGGRVGRDAVIDRFCAESGLPRELVDPVAPYPTERIRAFFEARLFGQPAAVEAMVDVLAAAKADVARWGRPLASLLLVGPTGVGKTETARATAELLFGSASRMVRFDMSEVATPWAVSRLVDGPDGEGALTVAVRRQPFSVVLFDEVEKAHPAFLDLLLQILGEGRLTDGRGRTADWSSTVVLLTSNVGSAEAARGTPGLAPSGAPTSRYHEAVARWLRPELRNRLDRVLVFDPLSAEAVARVLDRELAALGRRPGLARSPLTLTDAARTHLARAGHHPRWGARELLRVLHHEVAAPIARALSGWPERTPPRLHVDVVDGAVAVSTAPGDRGARDDLGDADHLRASAGRRRLGEVVRGGAFAELSAQLQDEARRAARGERVTGIAAAHRQLLADLRAELDEARALERRAGRAALRGERDDGAADALVAWEQRALTLGRALVQATSPGTSSTVVAVYGRFGLAPLVRLVQAAAEAHGLRAGPARVWLRATPLRDSAFWVEGTAGETPPLGAEVGVELLVQGPAASLAFAPLAQLWRLPGAEGSRARILTAPGGRAEWEKRRPPEPHRKAFFTGNPTAQWDAERRGVDPAAPWLAELASAFEAAVYAALT